MDLQCTLEAHGHKMSHSETSEKNMFTDGKRHYEISLYSKGAEEVKAIFRFLSQTNLFDRIRILIYYILKAFF